MPPDPASCLSGDAILDTAEATRRVLGDGALYLRMLRRFHHDHRAATSPIREAVAGADLQLAHRLTHTLKGSAGMIGAHRLHRHAGALEHSLRRHGAMVVTPGLELVEQALQEVLLAVERLLDDETGARRSTAAAPAGAPGAAPLLRQLADLLDTGNGAAIDLLEQAGPALQSAIGATGFSELMVAVKAFDFEAALASLRRALPAGALETPA